MISASKQNFCQLAGESKVPDIIMTRSPAPPSGDFFALGKNREDAKSSQGRKLLPSTSSSHSSLAKKPKVPHSSLTPLGRSDHERRASPVTTQVYLYEQIAKEVEGEEFLEAVIEAEQSGDEEKVEALICRAVKHLRANRAKPEQALYLGLMYIAKTRPNAFQSEVIVEAICSLLKRDISMSFKAKGNSLVSVLACNVLLAAYQEEEAWPDAFVKVYLEDSMGERVWVDKAECKAFVQNIQTAFKTKKPKISVDGGKSEQSASAGASPMYPADDEEQSMDTDASSSRTSFMDAELLASLVVPRYNYQQVSIESYVLDMIREQLTRRQAMDSTSRNVLRLMTVTCGYGEVRNMAVQRLEMWLQNPKMNFYKSAQDLLMSVCLNCDQHSALDIEVISQLAKIRIKNKHHVLTHYMTCMRELITQHPDNLSTLMTHAVYNELSQSRNPNNMGLLGAMFSQDSERAAKCLAMIFQDLLANKEDYLRTVRALFREIVRSVRSDMSFTDFAMGLMEERTEAKFKELEAPMKDRLLFSLTDMICLTIIMSVSPSIREAAIAAARGHPKDLASLREFQQKVAVIQRDAVWWIHTVVPKMFEAGPKGYTLSLRKVLFLDSSDQYHKVDNWPPEGERTLLYRLVSEVPVLEDTLMRILVIGLTREFRVNPSDCIDIAEQLVRRAALLYSEDVMVLQVERLELINALFHLCTYKHPDNIALPKGYAPPSMAIATLYWKAWTILLIISAFNPATFGKAAWDTYPTLRFLMEMVMTNNYKFPPPTQVTEEMSAEDIKAKERQAVELDKQSILEFEGHLAASLRKENVITEANSLLIPLLIKLDPSGPARKPPNELLEQLKSLNQQLKVGQLLCRSRKPNFLMDIIKRKGTSESMPWLADLVDGSEESLTMLPVQCLCEFLLMEQPADSLGEDGGETSEDKSKPKTNVEKQHKLLARLQSLLHSPTSDVSSVMEVLEYFLQRLSSQQTLARQQAVKGLTMVLTKSDVEMTHFDVYDEDEDDDVTMTSDTSGVMHVLPQHRWLLEQLPTLGHFEEVKQFVCLALRKACQVETDAATVSAYVIFLSRHTKEEALQDMGEQLQDLAQLIVERATLMNHILPQEGTPVNDPCPNLVLAAMVDLFFTYLTRAQEPQDSYAWSNKQDQISLHWAEGPSATMNILVVHAMIILLTYRKPNVDSQFDAMLDCWFPSNGSPPSAYLVDTSEEALLLPDWLKLRMIRSINQRLVNAALLDIEPAQLLLFVQSFGIPAESMALLLDYLDKACESDLTALEQVEIDKNYMSQLLEVQQMRGVKGGDHFMRYLKHGQTSPEDENDVEMAAPRAKRTESHLLKTPEVPPFVVKDAKQLMDLLLKMFSDSVPPTEKSQMFRSLQKTVSKENFEELVIGAMAKILNKSSADKFATGLKKNFNMSCPLLRLLAAQKPVPSQLVTMLQRLHAMLHPCQSPLALLVKQLLENAMGATRKARIQNQLQKNQDAGASLIKTLSKAITSESEEDDVEAVMNRCVKQVLDQTTDVKDVVQAISKLVIRAQPGSKDNWCTGLLVDWLSILDPETVSVCPELQHQLLFSPSNPTLLSQIEADISSPMETSSGDMEPGEVDPDEEIKMAVTSISGEGNCQQYLLALVVHQANWESVNRCVNMLLADRGSIEKHDPTRALDFLWACLHIPGIWQGRDKKLPKNYTPENVLSLTPMQIKIVVQYSLQEAMNLNAANNHSASDAKKSSSLMMCHTPLNTKAQRALMKRTRLLRLCCCGEISLIKSMVVELSGIIKSKGPLCRAAQQLLLDIYVNMPGVINGLDKGVTLLQDIPASYHTLSQLDVVSHRVINTLNNPVAGKKYENRTYDANIACRKFASEHPMLILRQLPLLAALLQGRAQYKWGELKHRNHLLLYTHVLGILELLQPYLFHSQYATAFASVLQAFFELIRIHSLENRNLASVVTKFVRLLHNFQSCDANQAALLLHKYVNILNGLSKMFPDLAPLRSLLAGLVIPKQTHDVVEKEQNEDESGALQPPRPSSPWPSSQLTPFMKKLCSQDTEEVLQVLQDLDETSKRKVEVIQYFISDLKRLMQDSNELCHNTAFNLVMRHIRQNPSSAGDFVGTFSQCLDNENHQVVMSALTNLAEFTLLAQEYAVDLLQKAFTVVVKFNVETKSYLSEALQLLNMETMH